MDACRKLEEIEERIERACLRSGRRREEVKLLGATKTVPSNIIREFYDCGLRVFGENRVQEFLEKYKDLEGLDIEWHFIGRLQSNKVKYIIDKVLLIHSLDRESLYTEIQKRASRIGKVQEVLVEVNLGDEETKGGVDPSQVEPFLEKVLDLGNLKVIGFMAIPPYFEDAEKVRPFFAKLREIRDRMERVFRMKFPELSMGMSHDFEIAVEEGATIVRIGTLLFGERKR